ncbi:MAG: hypothetical protein HYR96_07245 [Deltaproteobacteria bacterium]|nr:hypothetical protein [Deltaproteobacteria bacterium]MBI3295136.1 hypothetical protein [Deltaproteobacteria bacterium]
MTDYQPILDAAVDIAQRASDIALSHFRKTLLIEMKGDHTPVTVADRKTEEAIRRDLKRTFPSHGIFGEEFGAEFPNAEYVWTVDPIDGTRSFIRGIPAFGTLLGLLHNGEPVVGVMVLPALKETYYAALGTGTLCNGTPVRVSPVSELNKALVSCGDVSCFESTGHMRLLLSLMRKAELVRGYTDCFGHALLLRGSVDAMIDPLVALWDVAPIACLVKEAGGEYFSLDGKGLMEATTFVSCVPALKTQLVE